jgi:cell division protein FtsB
MGNFRNDNSRYFRFVRERQHTRAGGNAHGFADLRKTSADVEQLRNSNAALETEVRRLKTDAHAIESAARARLNMVRANEIVVPVQ